MAALSVTAIVAVAVFASRPDAVARRAPIGVVAPVGAPLSIGSGDYEWETTPGASPSALDAGPLTADGIMYVLSVAPGSRLDQFPNGDFPAAIYTSADGIGWRSRPVVGNWIDSIAASAGLVHGIGIVPGRTDGSLVVQVGTSVDDGATFSTTLLPFPRVDKGFADTRILANGTTVLALVTLTEAIDLMSVMPPGVEESGGYPLVLSDRIGVFPAEVIGDADLACFTGAQEEWGRQPACLAHFETDAILVTTWEELGLVAPARAEGGGEFQLGEEVTRRAFISLDGAEYEEVDFPFLPAFLDRVFEVGDTVVVSLSGIGRTELLASGDLRSWEPIAHEVDVSWVMDVGVVGSEYVIIGGGLQGAEPVVYRSDDLFGEWAQVGVGDLLPALNNPETPMWLTTAAVGRGGVAIGLGGQAVDPAGSPIADFIDRVIPGAGEDSETGEIGLILMSRDLAAWTVASSAELGGSVEQVMFAPDGTLVATVRGAEGRRFDVTVRP